MKFARFHDEIHQIAWWNLSDFMKPTGFHGLPLNAVFFSFMRSNTDINVMYKSLGWNPPDFMVYQWMLYFSSEPIQIYNMGLLHAKYAVYKSECCVFHQNQYRYTLWAYYMLNMQCISPCHEIRWISWNLPDFMHEIRQISWYTTECCIIGKRFHGLPLNAVFFIRTKVLGMKSTDFMVKSARFHGHEICQIPCMKSTEFHHEIYRISWFTTECCIFHQNQYRYTLYKPLPWNPPDFMHEICQISWNVPDFICQMSQGPMVLFFKISHEICLISWMKSGGCHGWNLVDFIMKSAGFHEIRLISWNPADLTMKSAGFHGIPLNAVFFVRTNTDIHCISPCHEIHQISCMKSARFHLPNKPRIHGPIFQDQTWNLPDFMDEIWWISSWNLLDFMKFTLFHEIWQISPWNLPDFMNSGFCCIFLQNQYRYTWMGLLHAKYAVYISPCHEICQISWIVEVSSEPLQIYSITC